jgi:(R,R)-butanediol dehydrogenase / meso-butanediol dehydrogenase / diacetyl reductase
MPEMKAAVWHKQHDIRVESVPDPGSPAPDAVRLQVKWCGICGTDLEEYLCGPLFIPAERPNALTGRTAPMVMGHEFVGIVTEVGSKVDGIRTGDHVAVDTLLHCGECFFCRQHLVQLCEKLAIMGLSPSSSTRQVTCASNIRPPCPMIMPLWPNPLQLR